MRDTFEIVFECEFFIHVVCIHMSALRDECICYQTYRAGTPSIWCKYICVKLECFYAPALLWGVPVVH